MLRVSRATAMAVVFVAASLLYLTTAVRGLDYADNGELAAVAWTLGIAHPTGYPTFTLLGHVIAHASPFRPISTLNLLAALFVAASAAALVWLFDELLRVAFAGPKDAPASAVRATAAAFAALSLACSGLWWEQAERWEVYSLYALLLVLSTVLFLRWAERGRGGAAFAVVLGLSFTAHMTTIVLAPAFLALWVARRGFTTERRRALVGLLPWFLLGLTPYLYLPLRSLQHPRFDWDAPRTAAGFARLLGARDYGGWLFTDPSTFALQWRFFFGRLPGELGYLGILLAVVGVIALVFSKAARVAGFVALVFAASLVFAGGYGIPDIGPYFLPAMMAVGAATAAGLFATSRRFGATAGAGAGVALLALTLAIQLPRHRPEPISPVEDLARDLLEPLPKGAVVLSSQWDAWMSGSFYLQEVEHFRDDVTVVDPEALGRPWYLAELARRAPSLCVPLAQEIAAMTAAAGQGEENAPAPAAAYRRLLQAFVATSLRHHPLYVTRDEIPRLGPQIRTIPVGLAFRVVSDDADIPQPMPTWRFRSARARVDVYGAQTCELYARSALDRAYYEAAMGRDDSAARWLELARSFDPGWRADRALPQPWGATETMGRSLALFDALRTLDVAELRRRASGTALPGSRTP